MTIAKPFKKRHRQQHKPCYVARIPGYPQHESVHRHRAGHHREEVDQIAGKIEPSEKIAHHQVRQKICQHQHRQHHLGNPFPAHDSPAAQACNEQQFRISAPQFLLQGIESPQRQHQTHHHMGGEPEGVSAQHGIRIPISRRRCRLGPAQAQPFQTHRQQHHHMHKQKRSQKPAMPQGQAQFLD